MYAHNISIEFISHINISILGIKDENIMNVTDPILNDRLYVIISYYAQTEAMLYLIYGVDGVILTLRVCLRFCKYA